MQEKRPWYLSLGPWIGALLAYIVISQAVGYLTETRVQLQREARDRQAAEFLAGAGDEDEADVAAPANGEEVDAVDAGATETDAVDTDDAETDAVEDNDEAATENGEAAEDVPAEEPVTDDSSAEDNGVEDNGADNAGDAQNGDTSEDTPAPEGD